MISASEKKSALQASSNSRADGVDKIQRRIADEMSAALPHSSRFPFGERTYGFCISLVKAFYVSLKEGNSIHFQEKLMGFLQEMEHIDENVDSWQNTISALRREMVKLPAAWGQARTKRFAEDMLHQARAALSESAQRQVHRHQYNQQIADRVLGEITSRLNATLDERQAVETLEENLAEIGIRHVRVALFESDEDDPVAWSVVLNPHVEAVSQRFPSRGFPPPGLYPKDELLNLVILPLIFQDESLGYVAFDADNLEPCSTVARQLAVTIKMSRLHAQVTKLSLRDHQ